MSTVDLIKDICRDRHIPISRLERECGFANGYMGQIRRDSIPADRLYKVALYLGVPLMYLVTGNPSDLRPAPSPKATELQEIYDSLSDSSRNALLTIARVLASKERGS